MNEITIYAHFKNKELMSSLCNWADEHCCKVFSGDTNDIIMVPFDLSIVDRELFGDDAWNYYVEYINSVNGGPRRNFKLISKAGIKIYSDEDLDLRESSTCILIDDKKDLELPKLDRVFLIDIKSKDSIKWIIGILNYASSEV